VNLGLDFRITEEKVHEFLKDYRVFKDFEISRIIKGKKKIKRLFLSRASV